MGQGGLFSRSSWTSAGIEAVLFDLGDTLIHFKTSKPLALLEAHCRPGYDGLVASGFRPPPYRQFLRGIMFQFLYEWGRAIAFRREVRLAKAIDRALERMGIPIEPARQESLILEWLVPMMHQMTSIDHEACELIASLHKLGLPLGLVSNTPFPAYAIDAYLRDVGLLDYFPIRVYSSDVEYIKPHPRIFRAALARLGLSAERVLYVGDRPDNDVAGAHRVGMKTVLYVHGERRRRIRVSPDYTIFRLSELPEIVHGQGS